MRFNSASIVSFFVSVVSAQFAYPELPSSFLNTINPVTPLPQGFPWGTSSASNTNTTVTPVTGVIRSYTFNIARGSIAPDGYTRDAILINGQFPGPLIEANWGDTIQVTVNNAIDDEGVALHWHGLLQKDSQWMDGVPGVQQCPIAPGKSFTYSFVADMYGTTWYHSHYSAQYNAGLFGPLIIHGPKTLQYDIDKGPILLTDWYHETYFKLVEDVMFSDGTGSFATSKFLVASDNNLINGQNSFDCSTVAAGDTTKCVSNAGIPSFNLVPGKVHRLRLINAGSEAMQKFSIDGHNLTVIANDFVPCNPYTTQVVTLGVGQRADVLVTGLPANKGGSGQYWMRSSISSTCSITKGNNGTLDLAGNPQTDAKAVINYSGGGGNGKVTFFTTIVTKFISLFSTSKKTGLTPSSPSQKLPTTQPWPALAQSLANQCHNDDLSVTQPIYPIAIDPNPPITQNLNINFGPNKTGNFLWTINDSSFRVNYNSPVLLLSNMGNNSYPYSPQWNIYNFGSNSSVRIVINNPVAAPHPIHLHGHNMFVLESGPGSYSGTPNPVNPTNPLRRDVHIVPGNGYMVLQFEQDNPGVWPLHCHIAWHVSSGLYVNVVERPADIAKLRIPAVMAQTCRDWATFTNEDVLDQIDSGL